MQRRRRRVKGQIMRLICSLVIFAWVLMMAARSVVASVGFSWATREPRNPHKAVSFGDKSGECAGHARVYGASHQAEHEWYELCERSPVVLEDSVSTAERLRPRIVVRKAAWECAWGGGPHL